MVQHSRGRQARRKCSLAIGMETAIVCDNGIWSLHGLCMLDGTRNNIIRQFCIWLLTRRWSRKLKSISCEDLTSLLLAWSYFSHSRAIMLSACMTPLFLWLVFVLLSMESEREREIRRGSVILLPCSWSFPLAGTVRHSGLRLTPSSSQAVLSAFCRARQLSTYPLLPIFFHLSGNLSAVYLPRHLTRQMVWELKKCLSLEFQVKESEM